MSFSELKSKSGTFDKLQAELKKIENPTSGNSFEDNRFWKPDLDKTGNGYAVLRFLPQPSTEDLPWVRLWNHAFNGPGGWYIENSLTTINKNDPVSEYNTELWNSGSEADKETARKQKRILKYYSNILVVSDPKHPENDGTVRLFRYGKKIFDKITEAMNPAFDDEVALNPFDFWKGANFKLKIRKVDGYWTMTSLSMIQYQSCLMVMMNALKLYTMRNFIVCKSLLTQTSSRHMKNLKRNLTKFLLAHQ